MKTLFIYNPNAGKMQIKGYLYDILNIFAKAKYDLTVVPTTSSKEAFNYVLNNSNSFKRIICSGGDGTLNEVVDGLINAKANQTIELGYIPAGSTNDFANSIKLPTNMLKSANVIVSGKPRKYDVGKFNNKHFVYIAAFGAFSEVSYATPQDMKNVIGHFAYILEGIKSLPNIKSYKLKVKSNDLVIEGNFIYGMISNTLSVGGIYKFDKKSVNLNDGLLEVTLIRTPKDLLDLGEISAFLLGQISYTEMVLTFKTNNLIIETEENIHWTLDGEYGGDPKEINIFCLKDAVKIINK